MDERFILRTEYGTYRFYDRYVVGQPDEGVVMKLRLVKELIDKIREHCDKPFVYIANRVRPSSVDLSIYPFLEEECRPELLKGFAIVTYRDIGRVMAESERAIENRYPFKIFSSLDEAKAWAEEIVGV